MKKSLLLFLLFYRLFSSAQIHKTSKDSLSAILSRLKGQDSLSIALIEQNPDSSAIGDPIGEKSTRTIGPGGGTISSVDGTMELVFPAGALTAPTEIGLQSVENTSFGGFGTAYACTPDGTCFQKPVELLIRFPDSAGKGIPAAMQTIRWQDKTGRWGQVEDATVDSAAHSIACHIGHFSTYAPGTDFDLVGLKTPLKVNKIRIFRLVITGVYPNGRRYTNKTESDYWASNQVVWAINDILDADGIYGKIEGQGAPLYNWAIYTAPAVVPPSNPVITAQTLSDMKIGPDTYATGIKKSRTFIVYDEFQYSFTGFDQVGHLHMIDSATCDIRIMSSGAVQVTNLKNPVPWSDWPPTVPQDKCKFEYPDKTHWKGMVEIAGVSSGKYYPPTESDGNATVMVQLSPTMGSSPPYIAHCRYGTKNIPSMPVFATPTYIQFETRPGGDIMVTYGKTAGMNRVWTLNNGQGFSVAVSHKP